MPPEKINDTAIAVTGSGPPVILVHGMGLNRHMWNWQIERLVDHFTVIRYDLLGHGDSDRPAGPYHLDRFVDQLDRLIDALDLAPCGLVGFSLGGMIVRAFTVAHPERVAALAILNSPHDRTETERAAMRTRLQLAERHGPASTIDAALARWFTADFAVRRPDVLDRVRRWMAANDPLAYAAIYRVLAEGDADLTHAIAAIRCPTLVLACAEDHGNSPEMARKMGALIPGAQVAIVPGLKHMGLAENPAAISTVLIPFLQEHLST